MAGRSTACVGEDKVRGVGADGEDHVAGVVADLGVGMSGEVVEEHVACGFSVLGRGGLGVGDFVESDDDGGITAAGVIEEETGDLLHSFDPGLVEERRKVGIRQLNFLPVYRCGPTVRRMLWFGRCGVAKGKQRFGDIAWHGDVDVSRGVVPVDSETEVAGAGPVFGDGVFCRKGVEEVVGVGFGEELDTEIVNGEGEGRGTVVVPPEAGGGADGVVAVRGEVGAELVVGEDGSFL